ncbi:hypothetical protein GUJ93_ZPchr0005g14741 [Zizania palustris]|uniref:Uncharacterized protein n=1 Tax=Zizania palustris TaxID=103762 RepID=A0A8J5SAQ6_ZIZPA|nr:hypothetical protein GUJ93_ZPchr0005g14741 [Zizania palustris]
MISGAAPVTRTVGVAAMVGSEVRDDREGRVAVTARTKATTVGSEARNDRESRGAAANENQDGGNHPRLRMATRSRVSVERSKATMVAGLRAVAVDGV